MNSYVDGHLGGATTATTTTDPPAIPPAANDDDTLNTISFGTLKSWLTATYAQHVAEIDKRLTKEINEVKKDLQVTKNTVATTNTELQKLKSDFTEYKKTTNKSVGSLEQKTTALQDVTTKTKTVCDNNLKYLINLDRNLRRQNVILFGVPEMNTNLCINGEESATDRDKCNAILRYIGTPEISETTEMFRLGKPVPAKVRPIKIKYSSSASASTVLKEGKKLKDLVDNKIYVKPDKTKKEIEEYQRLGKRKDELKEQYPVAEVDEDDEEQERRERVVLEKGVLTVDGTEVDRFKSVQTLF
jgi:hypothetical protein